MRKEGWYCVEIKEEEERINEIEEELPQTFKLFIRLAEIAKEGGVIDELKGSREKVKKKGVDCATNTESTSTVQEHLLKEGSNATKLKEVSHYD